MTSTQSSQRKLQVDFTTIVHASSHNRQLDDENEVFDYFLQRVRSIMESEGNRPSAENPYHVGEIQLYWIPGSPRVHLGLMSTQVGFGEVTSGGVRQCYDVQFQFYRTASCDKKAELPGGRNKIVLEPRRQGKMTNLNGDEFRGHPDFNGEFHSGTVVKMDVSYAQTPREAKEWTAHVLQAACENEQLQRYIGPDADEFYTRSSNPEVCVRTDMDDTFVPTEETLKTVGRLLCVKSTGHITQRGEFRKGSRDGWHINTDNLSELGFDGQIDSNQLSEPLDVSSDYLKLYRHPVADNFEKSTHEKHYLYHPKLELKTEVTVPEDDWEAVIGRAEEVLINILEWAGVTSEDLHADLWFDPAGTHSGPTTVASHDIEYNQLREYWNNPRTRQSIAATMYEKQTAAYRDVLHVIRQRSGNVAYDLLAEKTGLTQRRVREIVGEFVEMGVLRRDRNVITVVDFSNEAAKCIVEEETSKHEDNTPGERESQIEERANERRQKRKIRRLASSAREAAEEAIEQASTLPGYKTAQSLYEKAKSICANATSVSDAKRKSTQIEAEAEDVRTAGTPEGRGGSAVDSSGPVATDGDSEWTSLCSLGLTIRDLSLVARHDDDVNEKTVGLRRPG